MSNAPAAGAGGPGKLRKWWNEGKKRRESIGKRAKGRLKQGLLSPISGTFGNISRAKDDFLEEHEIPKDPTRGILETTSNIGKEINERVVKVISWPIEKILKTLRWATQIPGRALDHTVRAACKTAGAVPGLAALLLATGIIGEQAMYSDTTVKPAAAAHDTGAHAPAAHEEHAEPEHH